jgi:enamine deaminase RidA (YjgF/YER057c/UK114 family)
VEQRLNELGIELDSPSPPTANFVRTVKGGNLVFLSGHGPDLPGGGRVIGKVGDNLSLEQGNEAARHAGISLLSSLKAEIGNLNKVRRFVKVTGMVNADPSFTEHSQVINGFSDLMVEIFGNDGKHARAAVGMSSLPFNMAVEIDAVVEVTD